MNTTDAIKTLKSNANDIVTILNDIRDILEDYPDLKKMADNTWIMEIREALYGLKLNTYNMQDTILELNDLDKNT